MQSQAKAKLLIKKAFDLLEHDKKIEISKKHSEATIMLPSNKYGLKKARGKLLKSENKGLLLRLKTTKKLTIEDYNTMKSKDKTEENLDLLRRLRKLKPTPICAAKILKFHSKLQSRYIVQTVESEEPKSVLFPEENESKESQN